MFLYWLGTVAEIVFWRRFIGRDCQQAMKVMIIGRGQRKLQSGWFFILIASIFIGDYYLQLLIFKVRMTKFPTTIFNKKIWIYITQCNICSRRAIQQVMVTLSLKKYYTRDIFLNIFFIKLSTSKVDLLKFLSKQKESKKEPFFRQFFATLLTVIKPKTQ